MISHFFKSSSVCRVLCVILAALTLAFTLSPALVQPAEAVAVADDLTLALTLLFTSWAGITFSSNAGAQTAISNLLSSKPAVASSVAGLITKGLVTEGSKLLLTGDVRTAFRDVLTDIKDFFITPADSFEGSVVGSVPLGVSLPFDFNFPTEFFDDSLSGSSESSNFISVSRSNGDVFKLYSTQSGISFWDSQHSAGVSEPKGYYGYKYILSSVYFSSSLKDSIPYFTINFYFTHRPNYNVSDRIDSNQIFPLDEYVSSSAISSDPNAISFKQSKEIDGTQVTEIKEVNWGITFVPDPSDPTEDPNSKVYSAYSIAELLRLLKLNNSDDPGLDPEKMIEELRKLLQQQQPNPDPDPEPDPDPDPDPSDPDTPGGGDGTPPDFNGMMLPGLKDFFPFCIPFDLYNMMQALCAEPEAPKFQFATSFLGQVYTVDIDLSAWDNVAATIRYMVVAIYIVALAVATRKFIKW